MFEVVLAERYFLEYIIFLVYMYLVMSYCQKDANFPSVISQAGISIILLLFLV